MNQGAESHSPENGRFQNLLDFLICNRSVDGLQPEEVETLRGQTYEEIRRKLIRLFRWRGSDTPEELADRTFERVGNKLPDISNYIGDPSHYVCGVGRLIFLESLRKKPRPPMVETVGGQTDEQALDCLDDCMNQLLEPLERKLILEYYRDEKRDKIERRERIARQLGASTNSLRIKTCRIRSRLRRCVLECLNLK